MIAIPILSGIAVLILDYILADMFQKVAEEKGANSKKYFWLCFLFSVIGYCLVAALPDYKLREAAGIKSDDKKQTIVPKTGVIPQCAPSVEKQTVLAQGEWRCLKCGRINQSYVSSCACGANKREQMANQHAGL